MLFNKRSVVRDAIEPAYDVIVSFVLWLEFLFIIGCNPTVTEILGSKKSAQYSAVPL